MSQSFFINESLIAMLEEICTAKKKRGGRGKGAASAYLQEAIVPEMVILVGTWKRIKVEISKELPTLTLIIPHSVEGDIFMPDDAWVFIGWNLHEFGPKEGLED